MAAAQPNHYVLPPKEEAWYTSFEPYFDEVSPRVPAEKIQMQRLFLQLSLATRHGLRKYDDTHAPTVVLFPTFVSSGAPLR